MQYRSIALAVLSTTVGVAAIQATSAYFSLLAPPTVADVAPPVNSIESTVYRVVPTEDGPVVLLRAGDDQRLLPIWIGYAEARAIERARTGTEMPRPMTHDLFAATLGELDARVAHVRVDRLRDDGVYTGTITLIRNREVLKIDTRPSDAIALALRTNAPIYVDGGLRAEMISDPAD